MPSLPTGKLPPQTREPRNLFLYGRTKVAKTAYTAMLPKALHLDLEHGTLHVPAQRVVISTPQELSDTLDALPGHWQASPFEFLVVDTIDVVDDWADLVALDRYTKLPMGKTFTGTTLRELDRGAGFYHIREAFKGFLTRMLANAMWKTIFLGHIRDKYADAQGKMGTEVKEVDIDLAGKTKSIMCARMDAIGYMYRDTQGALKISFDARDQVNCGCRCPFLTGRTLSFSTPLVWYEWGQIYPDTIAKVMAEEQQAAQAAPAAATPPAPPTQ